MNEDLIFVEVVVRARRHRRRREVGAIGHGRDEDD